MEFENVAIVEVSIEGSPPMCAVKAKVVLSNPNSTAVAVMDTAIAVLAEENHNPQNPVGLLGVHVLQLLNTLQLVLEQEHHPTTEETVTHDHPRTAPGLGDSAEFK